MMSSLLKKPEREEYMLYIEPPYKSKSSKAFYLIKGEANRLKQYEDMYQLKVGHRAGFKYFDKDNKIKKSTVKDDLQLFKLLLAKRIDTLILTESTADYMIMSNKKFYNNIEKAPFKYDKTIPVHITLSKKSPFAKDIHLFNAQVDNMVKKGRLESIMKEYYKNLETIRK